LLGSLVLTSVDVAAGIKLDPDLLKFSPNAVLQADREAIATHNHRSRGS
jgi:hypothetical protein